MAELNDHELLDDFARTGAERAFAELVRRHINLVYSTAKRFTDDDTLAGDVTQAVFILLAKKAGGISSRVVLTGWLYQTARLTAANALKQKIRRQNREQEAYMQSTLSQNETDAAWQQIAPVLDDAMGSLGETDRNAVLLRYFEDKPLAEIGVALGVSEDAARVRVNRALEKLRGMMTRKGVTLGATAIAAAVTANAVTAAPTALSANITAAALTGTGLTVAAIAMTTLQKIAVTAALTVTVGAGVFEAKQAHDARVETARLQAQQSPMQEQIQQLQNDLVSASNTIMGLKEDFAKNQKDNSELLKLRGEIGVLREQASVKSPQGRTVLESWQAFDLSSVFERQSLLEKTPPQVKILPSNYTNAVAGSPFSMGNRGVFKNGEYTIHTNEEKTIGLGVTFDEVIRAAYRSDKLATITEAKLPDGRFDFIANLPNGALPALRDLIRNQYGITGTWVDIQTNAVAMILANPGANGFKPAGRAGASPLESLRITAEVLFTKYKTNVVDATGLTGWYDWNFDCPKVNAATEEGMQTIRQALYDQLGISVVPTNMPVRTLVIEEVK